MTHPLLVSPIRLSSSPEVSNVSGGHDKAGTASSVLAPLPPVLPARLGIDVFSTEYNKKPVSMKQRLSIAQNYGIKNIPISGSLLDVGAHIWTHACRIFLLPSQRSWRIDRICCSITKITTLWKPELCKKITHNYSLLTSHLLLVSVSNWCNSWRTPSRSQRSTRGIISCGSGTMIISATFENKTNRNYSKSTL